LRKRKRLPHESARINEARDTSAASAADWSAKLLLTSCWWRGSVKARVIALVMETGFSFFQFCWVSGPELLFFFFFFFLKLNEMLKIKNYQGIFGRNIPVFAENKAPNLEIFFLNFVRHI
jgi:hypothetical protein